MPSCAESHLKAYDAWPQSIATSEHTVLLHFMQWPPNFWDSVFMEVPQF